MKCMLKFLTPVNISQHGTAKTGHGQEVDQMNKKQNKMKRSKFTG